MAEFSMIKPFLLKPEIQKELRLSEEEVEYLSNLKQ